MSETNQETVLIPYFSDEVYHSDPPVCSFMEGGAETMTRRDAERHDYRPCRRCYDVE